MITYDEENSFNYEDSKAECAKIDATLVQPATAEEIEPLMDSLGGESQADSLTLYAA